MVAVVETIDQIERIASFDKGGHPGTTRTTSQPRKRFDMSQKINPARDGTAQFSRNMESMLQVGTSLRLAEATHNVWREWMRFAQKTTENSLDRLKALAQTRSPEGLLAVYRDFVRYNLEELAHSAQRVTAISLRAAEEAARTMSASPHVPPSVHSHLTSRLLSTTAGGPVGDETGPTPRIAEGEAIRTF